MQAYEELVELIATGPAAERIVTFRASPEAQLIVTELLDAQKAGTLTDAQAAELDRYLQFEHIIRLAKARAHLHLQQSAGPRD